MNNLITITNRQIADTAVQTVDARELHSFLENGDHFATWIKERIQQYLFVEGQDFTSFSANAEKGGRPSHEYAITLDMAKELAMVERNEKGKQARQYFIECERIAKGSPRRSKNGLSLVAPEFRAALSIAKTAGLKGNQATLSAAKAVKRMHGLDPLVLIDAIHLISEVQIRHYIPTELGEKYGESAQAFNKRLEREGLQIKNIHGYWQPTERGERYSVLLDTGKKHNDGTPVQQLKWLENVLEVLTAASKAA